MTTMPTGDPRDYTRPSNTIVEWPWRPGWTPPDSPYYYPQTPFTEPVLPPMTVVCPPLTFNIQPKVPHVVASAHLSLFHPGHLAYFRAAAQLGRLTVIVNNDFQLGLKGVKSPFSEAERVEMVKDYRWASRVILAVDRDRSVGETLRLLHELDPVQIFANGGDVEGPEDCREAYFCRAVGIELRFGVGGEKTHSSSEILEGLRRV